MRPTGQRARAKTLTWKSASANELRQGLEGLPGGNVVIPMFGLEGVQAQFS